VRLMTALVAASLPFAFACATKSTTPVIDTMAAPPPTVSGSGSGAEIRYERDTHISEGAVLADMATVWKALPRSWSDLSIPVGETNTGNHTVRSGFFKAPQKMGSKSLGDFLDCGYSMAGPRVLMWQVQMDILSAVRADESGHSRLATTITANAKPRDGTSTGAVPCSSKGELERLILEQVKENTRA
jgi:hypothetical protein